MNTPIKIAASHIQKRFPTKAGGSFTALESVDLEIAEGEFVALIGPSGCGKSTLLEILAGLQTPSAGTVRVDGQFVSSPGPDRAVVFQNYALFPWRTVIKNVTFSMEMKGDDRHESERVAAGYLEMVGLQAFSNHYIWQLSGGMKQRVGLARALACEPSVLLMDEPFGALDAMTRDVLQDQLLEIQRRINSSVVFVTHSVDEAIYLADRIVAMGTAPGRIVASFEVPFEKDLSRNDMRAQPEYGELHAQIWRILEAEMVRKDSAAPELQHG